MRKLGATIYERALEIIKDNMSFESGVINKATDMIEIAVKKQTPQKPDLEGDGYDDRGNPIYDTWYCPDCYKEYEVGYDNYDYCPNCGQALDWSE